MKAVLFDLGHTLIDYYCDWKAPEDRGIAGIYEIVRESASRVDRQEFTDFLAERLRRSRSMKFDHYVEIPLADLMGECLDRYGCLDEDNLQRSLEVFYGVLLEDRQLVNGAVELLASIKDRGLSVGLISDVACDDYVFSTDVGLRKPHPKMFKIALSNLGVDASEAMYVGNSLAQDIKGAKGVGIKAVLKCSAFCPQAEGVVPDHTVGTLAEIEGLLE